jgi:hypothetical protein
VSTSSVIAIVVGIVLFVLIAIAATIEGAFTILFGWISFLRRVLPEVRPDGTSVLVGTVALLLFGVGVHWLGRSWRTSASPGGKWRIRWTVAVVLGVILLFTAGISVIGITHQLAWLATSEQPMSGEALKRDGSSNNNMKYIGIGLHGYHDSNSVLPPGGTFSANGEMLHSWETHILPYMVISTRGIDMEHPWNAPENQKYFKSVLPDFINPEFRTPALEDADGYGLSHYAANSRVFSANKSMNLSEVTNGTANTIFVGEVNAGFKPWGHPINWRDPAAGLQQGPNTFGGPPSTNGTLFGMGDGSVRFIGNGADPDVLRALSDPRGK